MNKLMSLRYDTITLHLFMSNSDDISGGRNEKEIISICDENRIVSKLVSNRDELCFCR